MKTYGRSSESVHSQRMFGKNSSHITATELAMILALALALALTLTLILVEGRMTVLARPPHIYIMNASNVAYLKTVAPCRATSTLS